MASPDPDFKQKAADVIRLYLKPLEHAIVFSVDEKTAIQSPSIEATPYLPLSPELYQAPLALSKSGTVRSHSMPRLDVGTKHIKAITAH